MHFDFLITRTDSYDNFPYMSKINSAFVVILPCNATNQANDVNCTSISWIKIKALY